MPRFHPAPAPSRRRGFALLLVLALLTLFAVVGLAFVFYASAEATAARHAREAEDLTRADVNPELLASYFLGQLIYDVDDAQGVYSALRGHSLARSMYGWDADSPASNRTPYNGTGRLHEQLYLPGAGGPLVLDGYGLVNYTCYRTAAGSLVDGFLRDPERLGWRAGLADPPGPYTGGFNAGYTYPDLNSVFLAAVNADGRLLLPSFHRPWTGFGPLDPSNSNWYDPGMPWLKYQVLRPRPADMGPGFPPPEDAGGDVKNLIGSPGGNDSIWLDLDFPVQVASDGRKFKPLFAPLVLDLDNRVNVNVHGNVRGAGGSHLSNQGWGPWEVNLGHVLARGSEWENLFLGPRRPWVPGRYGADGKPGLAGQQAPAGPRPHSYAQVDYDGSNEGPGGQPTGPLALPGLGAPPFTCFPAFPAGYGNRSGDQPGTERWEHPALYSPFRPAGDDRAFGAWNLDVLLRAGDWDRRGETSELARLCPQNLGVPRTRRLLTTHSADVDGPGIIPWLFDPDDSAYLSPVGGPDQAPVGPAIPFPALSLRTSSPVPFDSEFRTPGASPLDSLRVDWRSLAAALGRVDLNRFLPPYPHQGQGLDPSTYSPTPLIDPAGRFDGVSQAVLEQFLAAQAARQQLADDIYHRLLAVTGAARPANPARPTDAELVPLRWLAQLAVNCVDFLDEDEISTPFNFYTAQDAGTPLFDVGAVSAGNPELPRYWVFGTELPRVVLNEVLAEYQYPANFKAGLVYVRVWAELFNPLPAGPFPPEVQPMDARPVPFFMPPSGGSPGYSPYRVVLANSNPAAGGPLLPRPNTNDNVLGTPDVVRASTNDVDFAYPGGTAGGPGIPALLPQGFFLVGPPCTDARQTIAPPVVPATTPILKTPNLQFAVWFTPPNTLIPDYRQTGITVLLRRLLNPHLPFDPRPAVGGQPNPAYNPYLTVDYLERVPLNNATLPTSRYASRGKLQPCAADLSQVADQVSAFPSLPTQHTFGRLNNPPAYWPNPRYDWLVHLDRPLVSPMELLHVSGYAPHRLTHRFITRDLLTGQVRPFSHLVPWFDESNRLYRVFEFLQTREQGPGAAPGGRSAGKINLNTVWDPETFRALCDPQPANWFTMADVDAIFAQMSLLRTPQGVPGPDDRPFRGLAVGHSPSPGDALYPPGGDPVFPGGSGIKDTVLRSALAGGGATTPRLFQVPGAPHPYLQFQLLTKVFSRLTTRSNVFAVWVTVGFFEVTDDTTHPVKLGREIGRAESGGVRHRFFAVVDRSLLTHNPGPQPRFEVRAASPGTGPPGGQPLLPVVHFFSVLE